MTRFSRRIVLGVLLLGVSHSEAQEAAERLVGSRVRVRTSDHESPRVGVLEAAHPDGLLIGSSASALPIEIRRADITRLEVSRGKRRNTLKGLLAGAVAWGAVVGLVAAFDTLDESGVGEPLFVGGMLAAGAAVGSMVKTERWERVPVGAASAGLAPHARGLQARFVWSF
jgi:hypothetical protein